MIPEPLVSIFCFCKDRAATIRRCIESVLGQTYQNFEFVVQDGASTDGTLEILQSYKDPRIKLVSAPDAGPSEGFWKVINRCQGDIVASCLSDEELLPNAIKEAVDLFSQFPQFGAITRDGYVTDSSGKILSEFIAGEFDFVDYLYGRYCPMWVASVFRRDALLEIGLGQNDWTIGCLEFEIWCRLATRHRVKYVPGIVAKYAVDGGQLSNTPKHFNDHLDNRATVIEQLFSEDGFFGDDKVKKMGCLYNQIFLFYNHARAYKLFDAVESIYNRLIDIESNLGSVSQAYGAMFSSSEALIEERAEVYGRAFRIWMTLSTRAPRFIKRIFNPEQRAAIRLAAMNAISSLYAYILPPRLSIKEKKREKNLKDLMYSLTPLVYSKKLYHDVASIYYGRGNIDYAEVLWHRAEDLKDLTIDSIAVQAALFSPTATHESLLAGQKRWAGRHAKPIEGLAPLSVKPLGEGRKIRVGYFCSFLDSDVFRAMFAPVVESHDRNKFTVIGYSVTPVAVHIKRVFDDLKVIGTMDDGDFLALVRDDEIDIFVEMSGFSPLNRFSAMASRCAPIQIAHFNHSGTSGVPNVDYVFADAISVIPQDEKYYSEKVWRLEGDFLLFNYGWANLPEPHDPPCLKNGYVTFGCFGSAGKLSDEIVALWSQVLHAVPSSRMYVRNGPLGRKVNRDYLAQRFGRHGIPESRLRLEGATEWNKFIASYENVDISLDTWPYCGANTIGESVWQGVPVISLKGDRFSSRYGSSHLAAAGIPELIANTPEHYVEIAAELAASPERIVFYRSNLRRMSREHGLADPERFARKLERAYVEMMSVLDRRRG
jgi:glycosyltransferase involved in cell wall biosynthesis